MIVCNGCLSRDYLTTEELAEIFDKPNLSTIWGRRDAVLLSLLYDTGAGVQEVVDLSIRDVRLTIPLLKFV